jgi:maltooligosyltrehalose synthase
VLIVLPRLCARLMGASEALPLGASVWEDTAIELPRRTGGSRLRDVLSGRELEVTPRGDGNWILAADVFADFPVALVAGIA